MNKVHKIPNVNIEVCNAEQKIAYNYLFSWTLNKHDKEYAYECVKRQIYGEMEGRVHSLHPTNWKRYNVEYILELFHNYYDKYIEAGTPIFSSYEAIGGFFNE